MNSIRRIGSLPGVREVTLRPRVRKVLARVLMVRFVTAAWETTSPWTLIRREYLRRGLVAPYRLKNSPETVWLKHGQDLEALYELIHRDEYAVPDELSSRLDVKPLRILDIGANIGMFSAWALSQWPDADVVAFEPEPENAEIYRAWARQRAQVLLVEAAASNHDGDVRFQTGVGSGSYETQDDDGLVVRCVDVFEHLARADFVKIDIEGGEWAILTDERMAQVEHLVLVMEYHRHMAPYWPPRDAAVDHLQRAGFTVGHHKPNYWGHGILWAWKE